MSFKARLKQPVSYWLFIVLSCLGLLAYALYTEHYQGLIPCALCMTQRAFFVLMAITALLAIAHRPGNTGRWIYTVFIMLWADLGALTAGRQVWLQSLPEDQVPACGPSLGYMLETMPIAETFKTLMMGDGNCAEVQWTFLGLTMPAWALVWFIALGLVAVAAAIVGQRNKALP